MDLGAGSHHISQPIIFRQHASVAPAILWLQSVVPPIVAGASQELARRLMAEPANSRRAAFVGCNETSVCLASRLARHAELGISVAGFFDDRNGERAGAGLRLLGKFSDLVDYVKACGIDVIFVAMPLRRDIRVRGLLDELGDTTASIYYVPDVLVFDLIQARTSEILGVPVVAMCEIPFHGYRGLVKRLMDVGIAGMTLTIAAPLMIAFAIAIKWTSRGSVIFKQRRYGLDGREFNVYKFRTMTVSDDGAHIRQVTRNDHRVTPLGRFLRRYSLDGAAATHQRAPGPHEPRRATTARGRARRGVPQTDQALQGAAQSAAWHYRSRAGQRLSW